MPSAVLVGQTGPGYPGAGVRRRVTRPCPWKQPAGRHPPRPAAKHSEVPGAGLGGRGSPEGQAHLSHPLKGMSRRVSTDDSRSRKNRVRLRQRLLPQPCRHPAQPRARNAATERQPRGPRSAEPHPSQRAAGASVPCVTRILGAGKPLEVQEEGARPGHGKRGRLGEPPLVNRQLVPTATSHPQVHFIQMKYTNMANS